MKTTTAFNRIIRTALCSLALAAIFSLPVQAEEPTTEPTSFEGIIEPSEMVNVGTPVEGVIDSITVERSSLVEKGQTLVSIESTVENIVVERADTLARIEGEIKLNREKLAFARRTHARVKELFASEVISAEKKDEAATEEQMALHRLQKALEAKQVAELDLKQAMAMLEMRTIKSPISGVIVERYVSKGEFVHDQPLVKVAQMNPLRVEVILPADLFRTITPGMTAKIIPELQADENFLATVSIVDRIIDPASGTFGVRLELPNPDYRLPGGLRCAVQFIPENEEIAPENLTKDEENPTMTPEGDTDSYQVVMK